MEVSTGIGVLCNERAGHSSLPGQPFRPHPLVQALALSRWQATSATPDLRGTRPTRMANLAHSTLLRLGLPSVIPLLDGHFGRCAHQLEKLGRSVGRAPESTHGRNQGCGHVGTRFGSQE